MHGLKLINRRQIPINIALGAWMVTCGVSTLGPLISSLELLSTLDKLSLGILILLLYKIQGIIIAIISFIYNILLIFDLCFSKIDSISIDNSLYLTFVLIPQIFQIIFLQIFHFISLINNLIIFYLKISNFNYL